jgi:hypothetical protein
MTGICTSTGSLNGAKILPFDILQETDSEVLRNVPAISTACRGTYKADGILYAPGPRVKICPFCNHKLSSVVNNPCPCTKAPSI